MINLRSNQIEPVRIGTEFFLSESKQPSLMVEPVAFGKSVVIAHIVNNIQHLGKTLVLQPSKELLEQNYDKFIQLGGSASVYSASLNSKKFDNVTYATIGSIAKIGAQFKELGYKFLIIDEADRYPRDKESMLGKFLSDSEIKSILGFTATPFKLQSNMVNPTNWTPMSKTVMLTTRNKNGVFWKDIIHITQIEDIIKDKYWCDLQFETYSFDVSLLVYNSSRSDYTDASIDLAYKTQNLEEKIIHKIKFSSRKSIVVFVGSVEHAKALENKILNSKAIYGDMSKSDRDTYIKAFREGKIRVLINVNVLSVGFDAPCIDMIIQARPTSSVSLYYQQQGRGVRLGNKSNCLIVDLVGNMEKFGPISSFKFIFKKKWILTSEDNIITDIPIDEIGTHKITEISQEDQKDIISFGKYKGMKVSQTPKSWRDWMLENFKFDKKTQFIKNQILALK